MSSRFRSLCTIFAVGMVIGVGGLMLLPQPDGKEWELFAVRRISDPSPLPCGKQTWPNTDRACLSWTTPRKQPTSAQTAVPERNTRADASEGGVKPEDALAASVAKADRSANATARTISLTEKPSATGSRKASVRKRRNTASGKRS
jgi:hypothetical protein